MCTDRGAHGGRASRASRRVASALRNWWPPLLGCLCAWVATVHPSASQPETSIEWVTPIGQGTSGGTYRFALCPDDAAIVFAGPSRLYRIAPTGDIVATSAETGVNDARSLDCADRVRLLSVSPDRVMHVVELDPHTLTELRRVRLDTANGEVAHGVRVLGGIPHLLRAAVTGPVLAPIDGDTVGGAFGMRLERPGRRSTVVPSFMPVFFREATQRFVLLETDGYSTVEFDAAGRLHGTWYRDDPDFARVNAALVPNPYQSEEFISGAAMAPDGRLAVQVVKRGRDSYVTCIEVLSPTYEVVATWVPPRKGTLFGWDGHGRLYFGYANVSSGSNIWAARLPVP